MALALRSYLYAPGHMAKLVGKVFAAGADAIVLDLEDAVPVEEKAVARQAVAEAVAAHGSSWGGETWVRINTLDGVEASRDLEALVGPGLTGIRVPKVESADALADLDARLSAAESRAGLVPGSVAVTPLLESARGVVRAGEIADAPRVHQLAFGGADFVADIGADPTEDRATLYARSRVVLASRAAGIAAPIAPVWTDLADAEGLLASSIEARRLGFGGRSTIHPKQLAAIHEAFTPSSDEIAAAHHVLATLEEGSGSGVTDEGRFVDPAVARRARATLRLAERIAAREVVAS